MRNKPTDRLTDSPMNATSYKYTTTKTRVKITRLKGTEKKGALEEKNRLMGSWAELVKLRRGCSRTNEGQKIKHV